MWFLNLLPKVMSDDGISHNDVEFFERRQRPVQSGSFSDHEVTVLLHSLQGARLGLFSEIIRLEEETWHFHQCVKKKKWRREKFTETLRYFLGLRLTSSMMTEGFLKPEVGFWVLFSWTAGAFLFLDKRSVNMELFLRCAGSSGTVEGFLSLLFLSTF